MHQLLDAAYETMLTAASAGAFDRHQFQIVSLTSGMQQLVAAVEHELRPEENAFWDRNVY